MSHINLPRVAVLMSTYNGEKYIVEQIDSILEQKNVDIDLHIRDDGSSDSTIAIIKSYQNKYSNIYLYTDNTNLGYGMSFMTLFYMVKKNNVNYRYYAFADQDDIWLEDKIYKAIQMLKVQKEAALYCSNQIIYKDGKEYGLRFQKMPEITMVKQISKNEIYGCTIVFNHQLSEIIEKKGYPLQEILDYRGHDAWIILQALMCGKVIYSHDSYIKYRIHDKNLVGIKDKKNTLVDKIKRWTIGSKVAKKAGRNLRMKCAQQLLEQFPEAEGEDVAILKKFAQYQQGLGKRIALIKDKRIRKASGEGFFYFAIKAMCNMI